MNVLQCRNREKPCTREQSRRYIEFCAPAVVCTLSFAHVPLEWFPGGESVFEHFLDFALTKTISQRVDLAGLAPALLDQLQRFAES